MLDDTIGGTRSRALYRLTFFVSNVLTGGLVLGAVGLVGGLLGIVFMLIDVLLGLLLDKDASWGRDTSMALWMWPVDMASWMLFGDRDFPWMPY